MGEQTPQIVWPSREEELGALEAFAPEAQTPPAHVVEFAPSPPPPQPAATPPRPAEGARPERVEGASRQVVPAFSAESAAPRELALRPFDPSTGSGTPRAKSRGDELRGTPSEVEGRHAQGEALREAQSPFPGEREGSFSRQPESLFFREPERPLLRKVESPPLRPFDKLRVTPSEVEGRQVQDEGRQAQGEALREPESQLAPAALRPAQDDAELVVPGHAGLFSPVGASLSASREQPSRGRRLLLLGLVLAVVAQGAFIALRLLGPGAAGGAAADGEIAVDSRPSGADVVIDGELRGQTPLRVRVWPGYHVVELRREGRLVRREHVGVAAGQIASQYVELGAASRGGAAVAAPNDGTLVITSDPAGARVMIDDSDHGVTPLTIEELAAGQHRVELTRAGVSRTREVEISAGQTTSLVVELAPRTPASPTTGQVTVASEIPVTVFENNEKVGASDAGALELPAGKHVLTLQNETFGFRSEQAIEVSAGRTVTVAVTLPQGRLRANATPWAEVIVDGRSLGETPIGQATLPLGRYELVFRHPELGERRVPVTIRADRPAIATVDFNR